MLVLEDKHPLFLDEDHCREWLVKYRYPKGFWCKRCHKITGLFLVGKGKFVHTTARGWRTKGVYYNCKTHSCQECVSPRSGTIFFHSPIPLYKFYLGIWLKQLNPRLTQKDLLMFMGMSTLSGSSRNRNSRKIADYINGKEKVLQCFPYPDIDCDIPHKRGWGKRPVFLRNVFLNEKTCAEMLFNYKYPKGKHCPTCNRITEHVTVLNGKYSNYFEFRCKVCRLAYGSAKKDTIFENSEIPLTTWFAAILLDRVWPNIPIMQRNKLLDVSSVTGARIRGKVKAINAGVPLAMQEYPYTDIML